MIPNTSTQIPSGGHMATTPSVEGGPVGADRSGIDQSAVGQPLTLLVRDLHVRRGEQENLVSYPFHPSGQGVGDTAAEVDHPALEIPIGTLHVDDHRLVV